ncbi:TPA: hypothetical protein ACGIK9_002928 [Acinetobacter baumannii]|uniref:hypothetical protein n=1 Tax=Acinetobacter baumannii TaxID=470 RepID=UPI00338D3A25
MSYHRSRDKLRRERIKRSSKNSNQLSGFHKKSALTVGTLFISGTALFAGYQQEVYAFGIPAWLTPVKEFLSQQIYQESLNVSTKQTVLVGQELSDSVNRNSSALSATMQSIDQSLAVKQMIMDQTLKGALPDSAACVQNAERKAVSTQATLRDTIVQDFNKLVNAQPKFSTVEQKSAPLAFHLQFACSPTEAAQNICNMNFDGNQFMDVDYTTFANIDSLSNGQMAIARNYLNFMNNVGMPEQVADCNSDDACLNAQVRSSVRSTSGSMANFVLSNQLQSRVVYNSDFKPSALTQ